MIVEMTSEGNKIFLAYGYDLLLTNVFRISPSFSLVEILVFYFVACCEKNSEN